MALNLDLPKHAHDKVKRALEDVLSLTNDPGEMLQIALFANAATIGAAAGLMIGVADRHGVDLKYEDAAERLLDMLKTVMRNGGRVTDYDAWGPLLSEGRLGK